MAEFIDPDEMKAEFLRLCTKHRLIFTHRHRFASSAQRFDKDRLRLFIKASLPARGVTISGDDRRSACAFAAPTAATSVSAAGPRAGSTRGRVLFCFFQSLFRTLPFQKGIFSAEPFYNGPFLSRNNGFIERLK